MYDIIIIGAGPAGLAAAIYASRAMKKTLVLEKNTYFKDMEELLTFLENKTFLANDISIIDYIGDFAQEIDVIQITNTTGIVILKREKLTTHKEFNEQYSRFQNKPIWEIKEEGIEDIITELKNQGQVFKQDEIDLENLRILSLLRHLPRK